MNGASNPRFRKLRPHATLAAVKTIPSSSLTELPPETMIKRGILEIPRNAQAIIVFAHGPGGSCRSPRNRLVARTLLQRGFAVALPDLADPEDDSDFAPEDDASYIERIATRLTSIIDWLATNPETRGLSIGLFGARTGAAAAMIAAARRPKVVRAIISRGGRPDLAEDLLARVMAPTLMIVGGKDSAHIDHNRLACGRMRAKPMLELVQGANHLFAEPGMLEKVASMSYLWFHRNLAMCG
jgi:putative phosphoribosyl transferase